MDDLKKIEYIKNIVEKMCAVRTNYKGFVNMYHVFVTYVACAIFVCPSRRCRNWN